MTEGTQRVVLALGSNLGDRRTSLLRAMRGMEESGVELDMASSFYETAPLGFVHQPAFLNAVVSGITEFTAFQLLALAQRLEAEAGRVRSFANAPRPLDVDLIFFGDRLVRGRGLQVPHPRWRARSFVVLPLLEILPGLRDPETGFSVAEIARVWPLVPEDVRLLEGPGTFRESLKRGNR